MPKLVWPGSTAGDFNPLCTSEKDKGDLEGLVVGDACIGPCAARVE